VPPKRQARAGAGRRVSGLSESIIPATEGGGNPLGEPLVAVAPLRSGPFTGLCPEGV